MDLVTALIPWKKIRALVFLEDHNPYDLAAIGVVLL